MDWILGRLACGGFEDADGFKTSVSTCIVTLCEQPIVRPYDGLTEVVHRGVPDEVWLPPDVWTACVQTVTHYLSHGFIVLVHCRLGVSRAPSLCAAYLISCGMYPDEALAYVQNKRSVAHPHINTWAGVLDWARSKAMCHGVNLA